MGFPPIAGSGPGEPAAATEADEVSPAAGRLLVLVPDMDTDETELVRRVLAMASSRGQTLVFLGAAPDPGDEPRVRRRLSTLVAVARMEEVRVESRIAHSEDWTRNVKAEWRQGDVVVCPAEARVGAKRRTLSQSLQDALGVPVRTFSGLYPLRESLWRSLLRGAAGWLVPLITVAAFFWIQVRIEQVSPNWARDVLLSFSVALEIILIWVSQVVFT